MTIPPGEQSALIAALAAQTLMLATAAWGESVRGNTHRADAYYRELLARADLGGLQRGAFGHDPLLEELRAASIAPAIQRSARRISPGRPGLIKLDRRLVSLHLGNSLVSRDEDRPKPFGQRDVRRVVRGEILAQPPDPGEERLVRMPRDGELRE